MTVCQRPRLSVFSSSASAQCANFFLLIRSCASLRSLLQTHAQLLLRGVEQNDFMRVLLVRSYSSFRRLDSLRSILGSTPNPSTMLWNSVIREFARAGRHGEAIQFYHVMLQQGVVPDKHTFTFAVQACAGALDCRTGISVHAEVVKRELQGDVYIGTTLVDMYCKLGMVDIAYQVFDSMPSWDVVTWNAMMAGFSQNCRPNRAMGLFREMQMNQVVPNGVTCLSVFPAVCELHDTKLCMSVHGFIIIRRLLLPAVANGLMDAYCKCGSTWAARRVFDEISSNRDDVSWATMISGYVYNSCFVNALGLFDELRMRKLKLNEVSVLSALSAAAETRDLEKGMKIHVYAIKSQMQLDISITTMLTTMYARCGEVRRAKLLFDGMQKKDVVAWSAMISAFAQAGHPEEAVTVFRMMHLEGITANRVTIVSILSACIDLLDLILGKSIHSIASKFINCSDVTVGTALVAMYAQCGLLASAHSLFDSLHDIDVVSWNSLIDGYAQVGDADRAIRLFHDLCLTGLEPDRGTVVGVLSAFTVSNKLRERTGFHCLVIKKGFLSDLHVKNALIDMYARCGDLNFAETVFIETTSYEDVISWNTMIAGFMQNGLANKAMYAFSQMRSVDMKPNLVTLVSIIPAAALRSSLRDGLTLHCIAVRIGFESQVLVGNCLIDMYSKCGRLDLARDVFDLMNCRDIVSWNAMLGGYALHGVGEGAMNLFSYMKNESIRPDSVSFLSVLSACRHAGLVEQGRKVFYSMSSEYSLEPNHKHYACLIDLLSRAGHFDEVCGLIKEMPEEKDSSVWGAILGAAKSHSNVQMGELAVEYLVKLEPRNPTHYVILANIYAESGKWADAGKMRAALSRMSLCKSPGFSWV
ncbi:Pentatricopeptide repeat-containing protein [Apostasia shenzhenica]|uniref:Pentatricopeptide repeat-containing protein n=1 Tax=Apostasia shenzhenica TaxID=1088818 RepID=A0A2I0BEV8_9ASPA|nr:Pentatricopeptide repeat-containing protein [Apostasia shenzhenica]